MKIAIVNIPFKAPWLGENIWITVPPQGYGGIQWIIKNVMDGLLELGCSIMLLGAPGSPWNHPNVEVLPIGEVSDIESWLEDNLGRYDIVHDHSCRGEEHPQNIHWPNRPRIHSHYLSSLPAEKSFLVAASYAHAKSIGHSDIPVVRHPINPNLYKFSNEKKNFLLFLGRVSDWKGTDWAAHFAEKVGMKLIIAGPTWESEYFNYIMKRYINTVEYVGEVGGSDRLQLLSQAKATLVFSKDVPGPTGRIWVEPGATVVSESAVSGTPVISSSNGCLAEIVPPVGVVIENPEQLSKADAISIIDNLPAPERVQKACVDLWHFLKIAEQYIDLYKRAMSGQSW